MKRGTLAWLLVAAALLVACGDDSQKTSGESSASSAVTTTSTSTTSTTGRTSTSTTESPTDLAKGPTYITTEGPSGSGCTPGDVTSLPDGWWAGQIKSVDGLTLEFDLVCWFVGDAANKASAEDGGEVPVPNDYYIRNQNTKTFKETFASGSLPSTCIDLEQSTQPYPCTVTEALQPYVSGTEIFPTLWLHVSGGNPDFIYTQYTP